MKIRDIQTGELYQLAPGSTLEIERTNPFFSDGGEQSLPMELPDTPQNRRLTGHPAELANSHRPPSGRYVEIEDGAYHVRARQMILSARRHGSISTSYLLEQSDLYARIGDTQLADLFGDDMVPDIATIDEAIEWLDGLKDHSDPDYDIFPVAMTGTTDGRTFGYRLMNARGRIFSYYDESGQEFWPSPSGDSPRLGNAIWLNAEDRTQDTYYNDTSLNLQKGYYMSPFIRVISVLRQMLLKFGYTLEHEIDPVIDRMVFVNNTIDAIVSGTGILIRDLLPSCSCSDVLDLMRYKFGQEFVVDERGGRVTMLSFRDFAEQEAVDITPYLADEPEVEYPESRTRIVMNPAGSRSGKSVPAVMEELLKYPDVRWNSVLGCWTATGKCGYEAITENVVDGTVGYDTGETSGDVAYGTEDMKSPDIIPSFVALTDAGQRQASPVALTEWTFPFIGDERALHSRMSDEQENDADPAEEETPALDMMIMLPFTDYAGFPRGGLTDYDYYKYYVDGSVRSAGIGGSLSYHGDDGLFERYWRVRDSLHRNALCSVRTRLILPSALKMSLSPLSRILIRNSPCIPDTLSITLGDDDASTESTFLSTSIQEPVIEAPAVSHFRPSTGYRWQLQRIYREITQHDYEFWRVFPAAAYLYSPYRMFASETPDISLEDKECCHQVQLVALESGYSVPFDSDYDEGEDITSDMRIMSGYLVNMSGHAVYFQVSSWFRCMADG